MSLIPTSSDSKPSRAEQKLREAFERLKAGAPLNVAPTSERSQNLVAREAGMVPSALRASRFPALAQEIDLWKKSDPVRSPEQKTKERAAGQRLRDSALRQKIDDLTLQRDDALVRLISAESRLVELASENARLQAQLPVSKVTKLRS